MIPWSLSGDSQKSMPEVKLGITKSPQTKQKTRWFLAICCSCFQGFQLEDLDMLVDVVPTSGYASRNLPCHTIRHLQTLSCFYLCS